MKRKFSVCLTKRHQSTAKYVYVVTQSAVESEDAEREFRTLSRDFEQVTRALNEIDDVIDMDQNASCEQYILTRHSSVRKETGSKFEKCFVFKSQSQEYKPTYLGQSHLVSRVL
jgi:hypothetical protein